MQLWIYCVERYPDEGQLTGTERNTERILDDVKKEPKKAKDESAE